MVFERAHLSLLVAVIVAVGLFMFQQTPAYGATFTVNVTGDQLDLTAGTGVCDAEATAGVQCTLRAAIQTANMNAGADIIDFRIGLGPKTITVGSVLPNVAGPTTIDGTTQRSGTMMFNVPCYLVEQNPCIEISGNANADGLTLTGGGITIRGLVINRFLGSGIVIASSGNTVSYNFIGTSMNGDADLGNGSAFSTAGIKISAGSGNTIGGTTGFLPIFPAVPTANLISGNTGYGVIIQNAAASGNTVLGNYIGTNLAGTGAIGNSHGGVQVDDGTSGNTIGGTSGTTPGGACTGACNLISGSPGSGVEILDASSANTVLGNFMGTNVTGTGAVPNSIGVFIGRAPGNTVGGTTASARNVISGNNGGVSIFGGDADGNTVSGNYIGTSTTGASAVPNSGFGVFIEDSDGSVIGGAAGTTPGGACSGACNLISGNGSGGIYLFVNDPEDMTGTTILGNYIGTNAAGTSAIADGPFGIQMSAPFGGTIEGNTIGGTTPAARNVISGSGVGISLSGAGTSGNTVSGNYIGTNAAGTGPVTVAPGHGITITSGAHNNIIGGATGTSNGGSCAGECNLISGNAIGVFIAEPGTTANTIAGNYVGTNADGNAAVANESGIYILSALGNVIGGATEGARNVISGNLFDGVGITDESGQGPADDNTISGNYIGVTSAGDMPLGNQRYGVNLLANKPDDGVSGNVVEDNVVSGNTADGVRIWADAADAVAEGNTVRRNIVGLNADGDTALPNGGSGVGLRGQVADAQVRLNLIGGEGPDGNVISGNATHGVNIVGAQVHDNEVLGNMIGTGADGATPIGNGFFGVRLGEMAHANAIGAPDAGNVFADNSVGVRIGDAGTTDNLVRGNFIGTNDNGDELGNAAEGVYITSEGNTVGGPDAGDENVIMHNGTDGVRVEGDDAFGNSILRNSIDLNGALGIELFNDGNDERPAPVLTSAENGSTHVTGSLTSAPATSYRIEFFASPACDGTGAGEGRTYLGFAGVTTGGGGSATIDVTLPATAVAGDVVTATATDPDDNTSEFSNCVTVTGSATPTATPPATPTPTGATPTATGATATPTGSVAPLQGDADCDGDVDFDDVLAILEYVAELAGLPPCPNEADVNCDAVVNEQDALLIVLYLADVPGEPVQPCPPIGA